MFISVLQLNKQVQRVRRNSSDKQLTVKGHYIGQDFNGKSCYTIAVPVQHQLNPSTNEQQGVKGAVSLSSHLLRKVTHIILPTHLTFMPQCFHILKCNQSTSPPSSPVPENCGKRMWIKDPLKTLSA